jgi:thiaminase/transcriptional activator TenA
VVAHLDARLLGRPRHQLNEETMSELYTVEPGTALARLIAEAGKDWDRFTRHRFVEELARGMLDPAAFRYYLVQDYRFLVHFARAWALVAVKSEDVDDIRGAAALVRTLIDDELTLHVETCAGWGLSEDQLKTTPEDPANAAYTRFVLERGFTGDLADLLVALMPCVIGYAEIGFRLGGDPATKREGNSFEAWIATYAGDDYQSGAAAAAAQLERVLAHRLGPEPWTHPRWADLAAGFTTATRLEIGFWEMGLAAR